MLADLSEKQLKEYCLEKGLPSFRGDQLFDAIYSAKTLEEISNIPKALKDIIKEDYPCYEIVKELSSKDGTRKYVVKFSDANIVECVLMKYKYGYTLCISTQVGCRMGCKFCASTLGGLVRNLSAGEILGQVLLINRALGGNSRERKITNLVLMGSGEPLDNFDEVCKFLDLVSAGKGMNISGRNISLSTCGLVDKIYMLAEKDYNISLTISLHATDNTKRAEVMPIANRWSIDEIIKASRDYYNKTKRRIYIEYTLIKGVNDAKEDVVRLGKLLKGLNCHVNIIPLNSVKERNLIGTTRLEAYKFADQLKNAGLSATVRRTMGEDIEGACGQLRNKMIKEEKAKEIFKKI